jgi:ATP-binding cassette subfamily B protein
MHKNEQKISYKDIAAFTWHVFKPQKAYLPVVLLMMGGAAFMDTLYPVVTGKLIEQITGAAKGEEGWSALIVKFFAIFVLLEFVYHSLRSGSLFLWNRFANLNLYKIVTEGFANVQKFSTDWHANAFAGGTVRKITRGMWSFDKFEDTLFMFIYPTIIVMVMTITLLFMRWPVMGWATLFCVVFYIAFSVLAVMKINKPLFERSSDADTKVGASLADAITGNAAVKSFGMEQVEQQRFENVALDWRRVSIRAWQMSNFMDMIRRYISLAMMTVMVGLAIHLWSKGQASAGDVVYVLTAYLVLSNYLRHIGEQVSHLQKAVSEMEDVVSFWKRREAMTDAADAVPFRAKQGEIVFDRVRFSYANKEAPIYDDFSLVIRPGEKVALVGTSGSGKSTFVKLVQRLYDVQGGAVRIDGQDIRSVTQESLRRAIALVPQEPILFHRSIATNIAYGKPDAGMEEIIAAAKKAFAHEFIQSLPHGYDTLVGERGVKLSGGERQRIAIARAILADCPILILDEATSSLDSVSEHYIQKAVEKLLEGRTSITIAHRLATIKKVDRILVFDSGRIVEQGTHAELLSRSQSRYKELYEMQALELVGENAAMAAE